jgi:hypothetical protein
MLNVPHSQDTTGQDAPAISVPPKPAPQLSPDYPRDLPSILPHGMTTTARRWVLWRYAWVEERQKWTKVPYSARTGHKASSTNPETWATFQAALRAYMAGGYDGLGFVLGDGWAGVDLDACADPESGEWEPWAREIVGMVPGYAEYSPSGAGLHIIALGELPDGRRKRGPIEMYDSGRFFTVTGTAIPDQTLELEDATEGLARAHAAYMADPDLPARTSSTSTPPAPLDVSDAEAIRHLMSMRHGAEFTALWNGGEIGHGSPSEGDASLIERIAWRVGKDEDRVARIFMQSPRYAQREGKLARRNGAHESTLLRSIRGVFSIMPADRMYQPRAAAPARREPPQRETPADLPQPGKVLPFRERGDQDGGGGGGDDGGGTIDDDGLPVIIAKDRQLRDITADSLRALEAANDPPVVFWRGGGISRVRRDESGTPLIDDLDERMVRRRLTECANFAYVSRKGRPISMVPPRDLVQDIMALPAWPFPALVGITETPVLRPDGSILDTPGYDAATQLMYVPAEGLQLPAIPAHPTREDVRGALALLDEVLGDFPYDSDASRAHGLALLLSPVVRPAINGLVPMALITAPAPGSGKGKLAGLVPAISSGRQAAVMTAASSEEEWAKKITSNLMLGPSVILLDNIRGALSSANLEAVLTSSIWTDRALGSNKMVRLPQRAVWVATGNNLQLGGDMPRRCYRIRLDAGVARPERRTGWRHPDLEDWTHAHRGELLAALLTLARAWYADGCPKYAITPMGSYEDWARVVGSILAHAGVAGFLSNLDEMYEETDAERPQWGAFFWAWYAAYGSTGVRTVDIAHEITDGSHGLADVLPELLQQHLGTPGKLSRGLGYNLRKQVKVRYAVSDGVEVYLDKAGEDRNHTMLWRVVASHPIPPSASGAGDHPQDHPQPSAGTISGSADPVRVIAGDASLLTQDEFRGNGEARINRDGEEGHDHPQSPAPHAPARNYSGVLAAGDHPQDHPQEDEEQPDLDAPCPMGGKHLWTFRRDGKPGHACRKCQPKEAR